jgi:hypothetical protein
MTSFRQLDANRRNARHSTGPLTEEKDEAIAAECRVSLAILVRTSVR